MVSPAALLDLTMCNFERSIQGSSHFKTIHLGIGIYRACIANEH